MKETRDELPAITKAFDLAREMTQRTRKLPRDLKFVLGDRMLTQQQQRLPGRQHSLSRNSGVQGRPGSARESPSRILAAACIEAAE
jgi:hypothetical protein